MSKNQKMMQFKDGQFPVHVGMKIILKNINHPGTEVEIKKIGRDIVYLKGGGSIRLNGEYNCNSFGSQYSCFSSAKAYEEYTSKAKIISEAERLMSVPPWNRKITYEQAVKIIEILRELP